MFFWKTKLSETVTNPKDKGSFPIKLHFDRKNQETPCHITKKTRIQNIRKWIRKNESIPQNQQIVLVHSGKILHNEDTPSQFKLKRNAVIHVVIRDESLWDNLIQKIVYSN
jgi:hypothetical protein